MRDPFLSIYVPVYNHENFIVQALDSILMQKTNYSYEVLVGEDASTDNSREVLKKYENEHPGFMTVFYRDHNMNKEAIGNGWDLRLKGRGKYCIMLEGDDYWTDPFKIQRQIEFLESHPEYFAVGHDCVVVNENSEIIDEAYPFCRREEYSLLDFVDGFFPGQTATLMTRNWLKEKCFDTWLIEKRLTPGDRAMIFTFILNGKIFCIQEKMSAYRHITHKGTSFSATYVSNKFTDLNYTKNYIEYAKRINDADGIRYAEFLYLLGLRALLRLHKLSLKEFISGLKAIKFDLRHIALLGRNDFLRLFVYRNKGKNVFMKPRRKSV